MKVELVRSFPVPGSPDAAWEALSNIEAVATCMPGAKINERLPDGRYKGTVTVRIGPASMSFRGELAVRDVDAAARSLRLLGKGTDSTGTSGASMDLTARIEPAADGASTLVGKSEVTMSGKAATFGGRLMSSVADQILAHFAGNFAAQVAALAAAQSESAQAAAAQNAAAGIEPAEPSSDAQRSAMPPTPPLSSARELNGLALLWAVIKDWLRGLFGKRAA
jgi:carbon monoxide dehydrogenase subunit G